MEIYNRLSCFTGRNASFEKAARNADKADVNFVRVGYKGSREFRSRALSTASPLGLPQYCSADAEAKASHMCKCACFLGFKKTCVSRGNGDASGRLRLGRGLGLTEAPRQILVTVSAVWRTHCQSLLGRKAPVERANAFIKRTPIAGWKSSASVSLAPQRVCTGWRCRNAVACNMLNCVLGMFAQDLTK